MSDEISLGEAASAEGWWTSDPIAVIHLLGLAWDVFTLIAGILHL